MCASMAHLGTMSLIMVDCCHPRETPWSVGHCPSRDRRVLGMTETLRRTVLCLNSCVVVFLCSCNETYTLIDLLSWSIRWRTLPLHIPCIPDHVDIWIQNSAESQIRRGAQQHAFSNIHPTIASLWKSFEPASIGYTHCIWQSSTAIDLQVATCMTVVARLLTIWVS